MNNELAFNLMNYIDGELKKLSSFDPGANKKGFEKQLSKAHKEGYQEGIQNIRKILVGYIKTRNV